MKKCLFCAEDIQDAAIVCKHCGRDLIPKPVIPEPERKKKSGMAGVIGWTVLGLFVMFVLLGIIGGNSITPVSSTADNRVPADISAAQLYADYENNEISADAKYRGQILAVNGRIKDIGKDIQDVPYLTLGENMESIKGVQAMFNAGGSEQLASLNKGSRVTVVCEGSQMLGAWVYVQNCKLR